MSMTQTKPLAVLTGPQKAAALMLAIGEERAGRLLARMHEDELRDVSAAMAQLGSVSAATVEDLCKEFTDQIGTAGSLVGSWETTERMLLKSLPRDRVAQIMEELRGPAGRTMWDKLGNVNEGVLANYLKNEYPQTVAVVLTKIRPEHAARVLTLLPDGFAMEVVMRMLRMESPQAEALEGVERTLKAEFMSNLARSARRDSHEMMAEIMNHLERGAEGRIMAGLEERASTSASRIRSLMFTFEDLKRLDAPGVAVLLRAVQKEQLVVALKGSSDTLRDYFMQSMSERASRMLRDDISSLGPVRLKDVEEAQMAMVAMAKELANQGDIRLAEGDAEEMIY